MTPATVVSQRGTWTYEIDGASLTVTGYDAALTSEERERMQAIVAFAHTWEVVACRMAAVRKAVSA